MNRKWISCSLLAGALLLTVMCLSKFAGFTSELQGATIPFVNKGAVRGTVRQVGRGPVSNYTVILKTAPKLGVSARRVRSASTSVSGQFQFSSLAPGKYVVVLSSLSEVVQAEATVEADKTANVELILGRNQVR